MSANKSNQKSGAIQSVRGMHDILPVDQWLFEKVRRTFNDVAEFYNFAPITTPVVEPLELFVKTIGETSDIIEKEMFTLRTKGGDALALRPEGTAAVVRAYLEHGMNREPHPLKLSYFGPFFRHEKPQAGRLRQFHQAGLEIFSIENDALYDAQIILASYRTLEDLKIKGITIQINTIGCKTCRPNFRKALVSYYKSHSRKLCADCRRRLSENPLRLLDCKEKDCLPLKEEAPNTLDYLCSICKSHFKEVLEYLEDLKLPYSLNHSLVRGLDYYTKTVFEFVLDPVEGESGLSFALGGGGRYDSLVEQLGGKSIPAVGVSLGVERILQVIRHRALIAPPKPKERVFLIHIGDLAKKKSLGLIETLREANVHVMEALGKESMVAQLRTADKMGSPFALIFGQKEAYENSIIIRDMKTGAQETVPIEKLSPMIKKRLSE